MTYKYHGIKSESHFNRHCLRLSKNVALKTATCGLLTKWLVDISANNSSDTKTSTSSTTANNATSNSSTVVGDDLKQRNQVADPIRNLIESVITKTAKEQYTNDAQENILSLKNTDINFLKEMMEHAPWRKLLIDLSATFPNSPLLTSCLKLISKKGYHREIAKRINNQSDYFDVFDGMLVSELCRLGNTAVNGNIFNAKKNLVQEVQNRCEEEEEWNIDMEMLVEDLKRTCTSTSYTYIYTTEVSEEKKKIMFCDICFNNSHNWSFFMVNMISSMMD